MHAPAGGASATALMLTERLELMGALHDVAVALLDDDHKKNVGLHKQAWCNA